MINYRLPNIVKLTVIVVLSAVVIIGHSAKAEAPATDVERYAGSFISEEGSDTAYWYINPKSKVRYGLDSVNDFSRLLQHVNVGVTNKDLLLLKSDAASADVAAAKLRYRGSIVLDVKNSGRAWYINPLDLKAYYLANGQEGFKVAQALSLALTAARLEMIPVTDELGFTEVNAPTLNLPSEESIDFSVYQDAWNVIHEEFLQPEKLSDKQLFYGSMKGLATATGDDYSVFWTPDENRQQQDTFRGDVSIDGIGAVLGTRDNFILVLTVLENTPAQVAGLKSGDLILAVDGESTKGKSVDDVVPHIKGARGTTVRLTIQEAATGLQRDLNIVRAKISVPLINAEIIGDDLLYFRFHLFTTSIAADFNRLLDKYWTPNIKGVIIDMRDNPGGATSGAIDLTDMWLIDDQTILTEHHNDINFLYEGSAGGRMRNIPTVVLVNENTASASEIFTRSLQYYDQAKVVGTQTYGKGTGQNIFSFSDGSAMKFTTFEWYSADGQSIEKVGLKPDYEVRNTQQSDLQLERAKDLIRYTLKPRI